LTEHRPGGETRAPRAIHCSTGDKAATPGVVDRIMVSTGTCAGAGMAWKSWNTDHIYAKSGYGNRGHYGGDLVRDGFPLVIPHNRIVALVGPNGAGKSTLMGLITGLLRPTTGRITVFGDRPCGRPVRPRRAGPAPNPTWSHWSWATCARHAKGADRVAR
jgi:hypothetical protein